MSIEATFQTKLACVGLVAVIINVCLLIGMAVIAFISKDEMCKSDKDTDLPGRRLWDSEDEHEYIIFYKTQIAKHPWMLAFLILPEQTFIGSASIISKNWAITTAYAVEKVSHYPISKKGFRGGSTFWNKHGFYHFAIKIIPHEKYDSMTFDYNVALIAVSHPFTNLNEVSISIFLENSKFSRKNIHSEVIGWAVINNETNHMLAYLLRSKVSLLPNEECRATVSRIKKDNSTFRSLCARHRQHNREKNICTFTTGSSLVTNRTLIGLASWGATCNENEWPGVYLHLITVKSWIEKVLT